MRPHRHIDPPKSETFVVLEGRVAVLVFDEQGQVTEAHRLGEGEPSIGIDLKAGLWHTILALSDEAVCFEVKPGPWQPSTDKDFAEWAPKEGDSTAEKYLTELEQKAIQF